VNADYPTYEEVRIATARAAGWKGKSLQYEPPKILGWEPTVKVNFEKAKKILGWTPKHKQFLEEVDLQYKSYRASKELQL